MRRREFLYLSGIATTAVARTAPVAARSSQDGRRLDEIGALDVAHFVPGHGELMNARDVARLRSQIAAFYAGVAQGYRQGRSETEIRKTIDVSQWERLERSYVISRNIGRAFLEAQEEAFAK